MFTLISSHSLKIITATNRCSLPSALLYFKNTKMKCGVFSFLRQVKDQHQWVKITLFTYGALLSNLISSKMVQDHLHLTLTPINNHLTSTRLSVPTRLKPTLSRSILLTGETLMTDGQSHALKTRLQKSGIQNLAKWSVNYLENILRD